MTTPDIDPRRVEYLPIADLVPDERNPKSHDVPTIDSSIGRFGVLDLIVRDERTGKIISGHGRSKVLAAREEKGETPPEGVKVDPVTGAWLVPVVTGWASRTDTEAAAALIALNRTTELGGWVDDALLDLLDEIESAGEGALEGVGYTEAEVDDLRRLIDSAGETDVHGEWEASGLPDLENEEQQYFRSIHVHFDDQEAVDEFFSRLGVPPTQARWMHFPPIDPLIESNREYVVGGTSGD